MSVTATYGDIPFADYYGVNAYLETPSNAVKKYFAVDGSIKTLRPGNGTVQMALS